MACAATQRAFSSSVFAQSLGSEDPLEKEMAAQSSILACEIPRTKEPGRLQIIGSQESDST